MKHLLLTLFVITVLSLKSQDNYLKYYRLINSAEEEILVAGNSNEGIKLFDKAFKTVETPFPKDCFIAAQLAYYVGDTTKFLSFMQLAFNQGVTIECLKNPKIFESVLSNQVLMMKVKLLYEQRKIQQINEAIRDSIYLRNYKAQKIKRSAGFSMEIMRKFSEIEKNNFIYAVKLLGKGKFPSSRVIGLDSDEEWASFLKRYNLEPLSGIKNIKGLTLTAIPTIYELDNQKAYYGLLHYSCLFQEYKEHLWDAVENGYLTPKHYGLFEENYASGAPKWWKEDWYCDVNKEVVYYGIYREFRVDTPELLKKLEKRRYEKYMQKYSVDQLKLKWEREKGFVFFFGHLDKI